MYKLKVNNRFDFEVDKIGEALSINNKTIKPDVKHTGANSWHIIEQMASYNAEVVEFDKAAKTATIRVNNNTYQVSAKDPFDLLLEQMGLSNLTTAKISELKAPMPGLVLKVFVKAGATVQKGDNLFILEAMKMENIIKAPADTIIKSIRIKPGDKVEKGQILLHFA